MSIIEIKNHFKLPIDFSNTKMQIFKNMYSDLELLKTADGKKSFYHFIFDPKTKAGEIIMEKWAENYTYDPIFLKDSQKLYSNFNIKNKNELCENTWNIWKNTKTSDNFIEKYQFIESSNFQWLNESSIFLLILSFYSIISPVLNLLAPIIILLIPFIILKLMKIPINAMSYTKILLEQLDKHSFGQLFTRFTQVSTTQKMYLLLCFGMYIYNIYQSIISCYQFYNNTYFINKYFNTFKEYLNNTKLNLQKYIQNISPLKSYQTYSKYLSEKFNEINVLYNTINSMPRISPNPLLFKNMGFVMKQFYLMNTSENIEHLLYFSFGFNGYLDTLEGLDSKIKKKTLNKAVFTKKKYITITDNYYPLICDKIVKNNIKIKNNIIITGPNAAGKTTLLKSTILNILLTQQIGMGFYKKIKIQPFHYIYCYLNIPDTSGRDSLFQAEARRCGDILSTINAKKNKRHFCIFDELYSGTNPYEAIASAYGYLEFISNNKNVTFLLTTHFIKLCDLFKKHARIENFNMHTIMNGDKPKYTYKITRGISQIKGGISVLQQLSYPKQIIEKTKNILNIF
jgi:DNA mismatch repair ATPase MutS